MKCAPVATVVCRLKPKSWHINSEVFNPSNILLIQFGGVAGAEQARFHVTYAGGGGELDSFCHILLNIAQ